MEAEEVISSRSVWQWALAIAMGFFGVIDFLLFSLVSTSYLAMKRWLTNEKSLAKENTKAHAGAGLVRELRAVGEFLRPKHARALARVIKPTLAGLRNRDLMQIVTDKSLKPFEHAFNNYQPAKQWFWDKLGLSISLSYGIGSAVMVFFLIYMAGWSLIPLILIGVVFCGANLVVNTAFATYYMPKVFQWLFAQGGVMEGMYYYLKKDDKGNVIEVLDMTSYQRSLVRMGFVLSLGSALAMSSLTFAALVWAIAVVGATPFWSIFVAAIIGVITLVFMTVLFTNFWVEVAEHGGLISYLRHTWSGMLKDLTPNEQWAAIAVFWVNFTVVAVGFTFMALLCFPFTAALISPLATYIGMVPGIIAQLPNIMSFTTSMTRKIILKFRQYYLPLCRDFLQQSGSSQWVNWIPRSFRVTGIILFVFVAEVLRMASLVALISVFFVPMVAGLFVSDHIHKQNRKADGIDEDVPKDDDYRLTIVNIKQYVQGSHTSSTLDRCMRGLMLAFFTLIPCVPLILLINHLEVGLMKRSTANPKLFLKSREQVNNSNKERAVKQPYADKASDAEDQQLDEQVVRVPRPAFGVLIFNEVLSNAFAYAVDVSIHTINFWALLTTFVFTLYQRGDTQVTYKQAPTSVYDKAQEHWAEVRESHGVNVTSSRPGENIPGNDVTEAEDLEQGSNDRYAFNFGEHFIPTEV